MKRIVILGQERSKDDDTIVMLDIISAASSMTILICLDTYFS